jgi:hypothetical protein
MCKVAANLQPVVGGMDSLKFYQGWAVSVKVFVSDFVSGVRVPVLNPRSMELLNLP